MRGPTSSKARSGKSISEIRPCPANCPTANWVEPIAAFTASKMPARASTGQRGRSVASSKTR